MNFQSQISSETSNFSKQKFIYLKQFDTFFVIEWKNDFLYIDDSNIVLYGEKDPKGSWNYSCFDIII